MFTKDHAIAIAQGSKTTTRRLWDVCRVKVGRCYPIQTDYRTKAKGYIEVTAVRREELGHELSILEALKEGGYSPAAFRRVWEEINGSWNPAALVYVVDFRYVGLTRPLAPGGGQ